MAAITAGLGLAVGLAFGYASQRGRFCMLSAVHEIATGRAPDMMRAYLLAVLVQLLAVNALVQLGYLQADILPFFGIATALGGGLLMGLGAGLVEGDNVLHGLTRVPLLAMSSVTFMLCAFVTSWFGVKLGWLGK